MTKIWAADICARKLVFLQIENLHYSKLMNIVIFWNVMYAYVFQMVAEIKANDVTYDINQYYIILCLPVRCSIPIIALLMCVWIP